MVEARTKSSCLVAVFGVCRLWWYVGTFRLTPGSSEGQGPAWRPLGCFIPMRCMAVRPSCRSRVGSRATLYRHQLRTLHLAWCGGGTARVALRPVVERRGMCCHSGAVGSHSTPDEFGHPNGTREASIHRKTPPSS